MSRWRPAEEPDELVFAVCERFLRGEKASKIAKWVRESFERRDFQRTQIYPLLGEGIRRQFFQLFPPLNIALASEIKKIYGIGGGMGYANPVTVVDLGKPAQSGGAREGADLHTHLTTVAADLVVSLINKVAQEKQQAQARATPSRTERRRPDPEDRVSSSTKGDQEKHCVEVHLGLGGGRTATMVARTLAYRLVGQKKLPKLVIYTLSAGGFLPSEPHKSPVSYFSYFDGLPCPLEYVALFSETVVSSQHFDWVRKNPSVRRVMERARELDIVVTSLASAEDEHGLLRRYLQWLVDSEDLPAEKLQEMKDAGWVGDVQFRPYSENGPMDDLCGVRAVTLLEIEDMVRWAAWAHQPSQSGSTGSAATQPPAQASSTAPISESLQHSGRKYVVLVAGPCAECGRLKTDALVPLLRNPNLRVFTHLVVDRATAMNLIELSQRASLPTSCMGPKAP
jgi:hypothetical protein